VGDLPVGLVTEDGQCRVLVTFGSQSQAETALKRLPELGEVKAAGGSVSFYGEAALLVYVPRAEAAEPVAKAVRSALDGLGTKPLRVSVDRWLPEEMRWDGDPRPGDRKIGSDWDVFDLLTDLITGLGSWP
jgi:hypothetical protein